jgi:hypothetical protein
LADPRKKDRLRAVFFCINYPGLLIKSCWHERATVSSEVLCAEALSAVTNDEKASVVLDNLTLAVLVIYRKRFFRA